MLLSIEEDTVSNFSCILSAIGGAERRGIAGLSCMWGVWRGFPGKRAVIRFILLKPLFITVLELFPVLKVKKDLPVEFNLIII